MHSTVRLCTSIRGQQPCFLGTGHLPLNSIKLVPAKDWGFMRYNVRPGNEIPWDRRATTNLIRFWFKCQTPISYHMQHSKPLLDIAVYCTCSLLWRREWMTCGRQEQAPRTTWNTRLGSTDQMPPLVILLMSILFLQYYHTIHRTKVPFFCTDFILGRELGIAIVPCFVNCLHFLFYMQEDSQEN